jgi:E3 ubiquitin-protein ligase HERC2
VILLSSQVVGQTEEADPLHPNLDDFTSLLGQDDARMLVDLLKLAVAARAIDTAKETIVSVLVGKCHYILMSSLLSYYAQVNFHNLT